MPTLLIVAWIVVAGYIAWAAIVAREGRAGADALRSPLDVGRLRRDMLASATSAQERAYLEELDRLELHRRHLVC